MQKIQVAVLDIGSSKITAVVGERGINKTFVIKGEKSFPFEGFCVGEIYDEDEFKSALISCAEFIKKTSRTSPLRVYVGVPSAFTSVFVKESQISFAKKKKITDNDVDALFDSAFVLQSTKQTLINRSAIVYELDDYRRLANPIGSNSEILKGKLSFVLCQNYFIDLVRSALKVGGIMDVEFVSMALCEAMYLIDAEVRDRIAEILDVGYITTTFSIVQGDGIIYQKTFDYGGGFITADLTKKLGTSFDLADEIKKKINLSKLSVNAFDVIEGENGEMFNALDINDCVLSSLDNLCENISLAIENSGYVVPEYVPLMITGGGISFIRGAKEHISKRLGCSVEIVAPKLPMHESPIKSSTLSLLDLALMQNGQV